MKKSINYVLVMIVYCSLMPKIIHAQKNNFTDFIPASKQKTLPLHVEFADLDNDGNQDILSVVSDSLGLFSITIWKQKLENQQSKFIKIDSLFDSTFSNLYPQLAVKLADIDNDNDIDLILTSKDSTQSKFLILANKGKFKFDSLYATTLSSVGDFTISDFNNDGFKDIFINSNVLDSTSKKARIILNIENRFKIQSVEIPIYVDAVCHSLDYDNNQRDDIFISGIDSLKKVNNLIFLNNNLDFSSEKLPLGNILATYVDVGDCNSDGTIDIVISGEDSNKFFKTKLLLNMLGNNSIITIDSTTSPYKMLSIVDLNHDGMLDLGLAENNANGFALNKIYFGSKDSLSKYINSVEIDSLNHLAGIGDINADGNPDLYTYSLQKDSVFANIYINKSTFNSSPALPIDNATIQINDLVFFDWERQPDDATPIESISYEIFLKSSNKYIVTAETDTNGIRLVNKIGSKQYASTIYFKGLPKGEYNWGVRSIDNAWKGGSKEVGGFCIGNASIESNVCSIEKRDTLVCEGTSLKFVSTNNVKCIWYSEALGILGKSTTLDYVATTNDTLYCMQRKSDDCDKSYFVIIKTQKKQQLELGKDKSICKGDSLEVIPTGKWDTYNWKFNQKPIATTVKLSKYNVENTGYLSLQTNTIAGCMDKDSILVTLKNKITLTAGPDIITCTDDTLSIKVKDAKKCIWTLNNITIDTAAVKISLTPPTIPIGQDKMTLVYEVLATDTLGCNSKDSVQVVYFKRKEIKGIDTTLCIGDTIFFSPGLGFYTYKWQLNNNEINDYSDSYYRFKAKEIGLFQFRVDVTQKCGVSTAPYNINVVAPPNSIKVDTVINFGQSIALQMPTAVTTSWLPLEELDNPSANNITATPQQNIVYTAQSVNQFGCKYSGTFSITMRGNLSIPQLFSPNGDATNDNFKIYGFGISEINLSIVDRNGVKVYQTSNLADATNKGWDGTHDGSLMPDGVYFWQIQGKFFDGKNLTSLGENQGEIRLVR